MRYLLFLSLLLSLAFAQNDSLKHDYVWRRGDAGANLITDFNHTPPIFSVSSTGISVDNGGSCISNRQGQLQLISNGFAIADTAGNTLIAGLSPDDINAGFWTGAPGFKSSTWVEDPADSTRYYSLHLGTNIVMNTALVYAKTLYYTHIGKDSTGNWQILASNQILLSSDSAQNKFLFPLTMTVCRHANGRDWWLLMPQYWTKRYCRFLITPQGIQNMGWRGEVGIHDVDFIPAGTGPSFTPDGKHYILHADSMYMYMWDFDRCSGLLSNERKYDMRPDQVYNNAIFQAFSNSGRYMYNMVVDKVYQWDLQAPDPYASRQVVSVLNGVLCGSPCYFGSSQLAPDGKIYISTGSQYWHIIAHPDSAGTACGVLQHSILLPPTGIGYGGMNHFPNYRLGALVGSGCDTIGTSIELPVASNERVRVYPNPARDEVVFTTPDPSYLQKEGSAVNPLLGGAGVGEVVLLDILGREVLRKAARADTAQSGVSSITLNISPLPNGIYLWHCAGQSGKLVISR